MQSLKNNFEAEHQDNVVRRSVEIRAARLPGFYVMISIIATALFLSVIGMIVQYSNVGNLTEKKIQF